MAQKVQLLRIVPPTVQYEYTLPPSGRRSGVVDGHVGVDPDSSRHELSFVAAIHQGAPESCATAWSSSAAERPFPVQAGLCYAFV
jgi:hypothetical protein